MEREAANHRTLRPLKPHMKLHSKILGLGAAGALALTAAFTTFAEPGPGGPGGHGRFGHHGPPDAMAHLTRELGLTDAQKTQAQPIVDAAQVQLKAIRDEARAKAKAVMQDAQTKLTPILTPAQQEDLRSMQRRMERHEQAWKDRAAEREARKAAGN